MSTSPLSPEEIRAAAEVHRELGPEYSDAVVASFVENVDRQVAARVDARLAETARPEEAKKSRRTLLTGIAIGTAVSGIPLILRGLLVHAFKDRVHHRNDLITVVNTDAFVSHVTVRCFVARTHDL